MKQLVKMKDCRIKFPVVLFLFLFSFSFAFAQTLTNVKGQVRDQSGEPVIGASVVVKGTTNGTITDIDGIFHLDVEKNSRLVISFVGYETQETELKGRNSINIVLKEDLKVLDEVVVVGYGTVKKKDATGSVATVSINEKNKPMATSPQELLGGKVAGVSVISGGGQPGASSTIRIRGGSSLNAKNEPLIVVDGVILSNETVGGLSNGLSSINPNDIETFTVLKDASATAIYGSRASNGVIMITTKKGSSGKVKISYNGTVSMSQKRNDYDVMSGDEFRDFISNLDGVTSSMLTALNLYDGQSTDWQDEIYRTAVSTDHNISAFGTVKDFMPYRVSFGYNNENGILKTSNFERYTGNISLTPVLFDDHLTVNINAKGSYINNRFADDSSVGAAVFFDPTKPVMNGNSNYGGYYTWTSDGTPDGGKMGSAPINPMATLKMRNDNSNVKSLLSSIRADYKFHFLPELKLTVNASHDYSESDGSEWISPNSPSNYGDVNKSGLLREYGDKFINQLLEVYGQYAKDFKKSRFDIMGGYSYQSYQKEGSTVSHYLSRDPENYGNKTEESATFNPYGPEKYVLISFFGRLNYSLLDKYLLTVTLRDDASSRFAKNNRWGLFPSVALGWKIKEESFLKYSESVSDLKLRLGWGLTGQQDVGAYYPSMPSYRWGKGGVTYPSYDAQGNVTWVKVIAPKIGRAHV